MIRTQRQQTCLARSTRRTAQLVESTGAEEGLGSIKLSAMSTLTLCGPDLASDRVESPKYSLSQPCPCVRKHLLGQESSLQSSEQSVSDSPDPRREDHVEG